MDKYDPALIDLEGHGWFLGAKDLVPHIHPITHGWLLEFSASESRSDVFKKNL